ncbi:uncharacterized protein Dana_GF13126, isoform C [Drosophila ananassae]|uniref:5'-nucleotidase n=1 Tax=Drosophila ananassae TaxID=7217 RepID=A0A0P8XP66_DROAN|nr:protein 5NUC isoform X1 [Drosophila ananassae]KPU76401.1 uncharacterized protein Dana_GF13126, isoform C [Drosophila ananassae]
MFFWRGVYMASIFILAINLPKVHLNYKDTEFIILYNGTWDWEWTGNGQSSSGSALNSSKVLTRQTLLIHKDRKVSQENGIPVFYLCPGEAKSKILEEKGFKMGVIGYLTSANRPLIPSNSGKYGDETAFIKSEAEKLKAQGINIIIALGRFDYQTDQDIARTCAEVDLILRPETITVVHKRGKKIPLVKTYFCSKCVAKIQVKFDTFGNIKDFRADPILLNDKDRKHSFVEIYRSKRAENSSSSGSTKLLLKAATCKEEECLLGNFMTDAMVYARMLEDKGGKYWTDAPIALLHAGAIKGSISKGTISADTINSVLPEVEDLMVIQMSGEILWKALEYSAEVRLQANKDGFLQVSGLMVTTNFRGPKGKRIESVNILCAECEVPAFEPLDESLTYNVIVPASLVNGCEGHDFGQDANSTQKKMRWNNRKAIMEYAKRCNIVIAEIEGRLGDKYSQTSIASVIVVSIKNIIFLYLLTKLL